MKRAKISGIYTITNLVNGKIYVGQSVDIESRLVDHIWCLNKGKHQNSYLQFGFNKHGRENFMFEILEECENEFLCSTECYWINMPNTTNRKFGYNIKGGFPDGSFKMSNETKKRLSISKTGKTKSEEFLDTVSNPLWKKVLNIKTGEVYRSVKAAAKKNNIKSSTLYMRLKSDTTDDTFKYINEDLNCEKRKSHTKSIILQKSTGKIFNSLIELSNILKINNRTLSYHIKKGKVEDFIFISSRKKTQKIKHIPSNSIFDFVREAANHADIEYTKFIKHLKKQIITEYVYIDEQV